MLANCERGRSQILGWLVSMTTVIVRDAEDLVSSGMLALGRSGVGPKLRLVSRYHRRERWRWGLYDHPPPRG